MNQNYSTKKTWYNVYEIVFQIVQMMNENSEFDNDSFEKVFTTNTTNRNQEKNVEYTKFDAIMFENAKKSHENRYASKRHENHESNE